MRLAIYAAIVCLGLSTMVSAQDAVKADPKHYTVISENDQVRILKIHYGPHEKSVMHSHPNAVVVFLTDANVQFTLPGEKKEAHNMKAGQSQYSPAGAHLPENMGDKDMDAVLVELKGKAPKPAAAKPAPAKPAKK